MEEKRDKKQEPVIKARRPAQGENSIVTTEAPGKREIIQRAGVQSTIFEVEQREPRGMVLGK